MSSGYHLTFDVDWAPDWSVRETLAFLAEAGARATFFVTHASPTIAEIASAGHEVGIHPNFQAGSTQGADPVAIVGSLLELVPRARVMRTHGLIQGSLLLRDVLRAFPQIEYDLSLLTYGFRHSEWFDWRLGGTRMRRLNYVWEDDFAFEDPDQDWTVYRPFSSLDVLDFHPLHISLNSRDMSSYDLAKSAGGGAPLSALPEELAESMRCADSGVRDFLRAVLASEATARSFEELL
ncbi:MAG: hypothetical protein J0G30_05835 [Actinomycetales bacterium]|nr:hypothetical protein [Actinomycetales bacterium]